MYNVWGKNLADILSLEGTRISPVAETTSDGVDNDLGAFLKIFMRR